VLPKNIRLSAKHLFAGKGENDWDRMTHEKPESIFDGSNGDIAADQYHKLDEDLKILKDLGVSYSKNDLWDVYDQYEVTDTSSMFQAQAYRFSLSWSRILPDGQLPNVNQKGVDYYNRLIDGLLANGINPMVNQ